ncbi:MAG: hypothetical protein ACT4O1_00095 [Gemmatimonadota bacterium]
MFRVAGAYAVAAWVLIQVATSTFPYLGLPDWAVTLVIVVTLVGFPVALVLSWLFQIRPEEEAVAVPAGRDSNALAIATLTVVVLALAGAGWMVLRKRADAADNASVVAVLPFAMRGSPSYAYLSTGMVDLLSRNLDHVTELRSADPGTVLEMSGDVDPNVPLGLERARAIAERINANYFVVGTVTENAGRIRIDATLHDRARSKVVGNAQLEDDDTRLFDLIDRVAADLLVDRFGAASQHLARTAATMTSSPEALKYYLRGEQALRRAAYDSAVAFFQHATEEDTTFALAYYRLAVTTSMYDAVRVSVPGALPRARQHGARLGERDRALMEAHHSYALGEADDAERRYQAILAEHPDDLEAQFQLGNVLYRYNAPRGRSPHEARPYYEKLFELDPEFFCPI